MTDVERNATWVLYDVCLPKDQVLEGESDELEVASLAWVCPAPRNERRSGPVPRRDVVNDFIYELLDERIHLNDEEVGTEIMMGVVEFKETDFTRSDRGP